jgi:hypothetical protein
MADMPSKLLCGHSASGEALTPPTPARDAARRPFVQVADLSAPLTVIA